MLAYLNFMPSKLTYLNFKTTLATEELPFNKYSIYSHFFRKQSVSATISFRIKQTLKWFRLTYNSRIEGHASEK